MKITEVLLTLLLILASSKSGLGVMASLDREFDAASPFTTRVTNRNQIKNTSTIFPKKIAKTNDVAVGELPFLAAVFQATEGHNSLCGACVIGRDRIITSAHCLNRSNLSNIMELDAYTVSVGGKDLSEETNIQWRTVIKLQFNRLNPTVKDILYSDFAIMQVNSPFWFSWRVYPISISYEKFRGRSICDIIGWGARENKDRKTGEFQVQKKAEICVMDKKTCMNMFPEKKDLFTSAFCGEPLTTEKMEQDKNVNLVICNGVLIGTLRSKETEELLVLADLGSYFYWTRKYIEIKMPRSLRSTLSFATKIQFSLSWMAYFFNLFLSLTTWTAY